MSGNSRYRERKYNSSDNDRLLRAISQPVQAWDRKWVPHSHSKHAQIYKWVKSDRTIVFEDDEPPAPEDPMKTDEPTHAEAQPERPQQPGGVQATSPAPVAEPTTTTTTTTTTAPAVLPAAQAPTAAVPATASVSAAPEGPTSVTSPATAATAAATSDAAPAVASAAESAPQGAPSEAAPQQAATQQAPVLSASGEPAVHTSAGAEAASTAAGPPPSETESQASSALPPPLHTSVTTLKGEEDAIKGEEEEERTRTPTLDDVSDNEDNDVKMDRDDDMNDPSMHPASNPHVAPPDQETA